MTVISLYISLVLSNVLTRPQPSSCPSTSRLENLENCYSFSPESSGNIVVDSASSKGTPPIATQRNVVFVVIIVLVCVIFPDASVVVFIAIVTSK